MTEPAPALGHNNPPVTPPTEADLLADLKRRYPKMDPRLAEFQAALATYPEKIADEDTARNLQDLLGQMKDERAAWKGQRGEQKKPWDKLVKVVQNFFASAEEKVEGWEAVWRPRLDAYMDEKRAAAQRAAEAEAARVRAEAEAQAQAAAQAEQRRLEAEEAARAAEAREAAAREEARLAEERRRLADEAAKVAAEEARRVDAEKKACEKAEREQNEEAIRATKRHMKTAESLHEKAVSEGDETDPATIQTLDDLIRPGGTISVLMQPVFTSPLLDPEQADYVKTVRDRLTDLRTAMTARMDAKEQRRREKVRKAAEAEEARLAEERRVEREADEARAQAARTAREEAEAAAETARGGLKDARKEVTAAQKGANEAVQGEKAAAREADRAGEDAERLDNRAGRAERKLESATPGDFSRTRGDFTTGSQTRRWNHYVIDETALRAALRSSITVPVYATFVDQINSEALDSAAYRFMRLHQEGWSGREKIEDALAGVVFAYETSLTIR